MKNNGLMTKLNRIILILIIFIIISTQGILNHFVLSFINLEFLRSYLFEFFSLLLLFITFIKNILNDKKVKFYTLFFIFYVLFSILFMIINSQSFIAIFYSFKEIHLIILLILAYSNWSDVFYNNKNMILNIIIILSILNLIVSIYSFQVGHEIFLETFVGRSFYGKDIITNFKISHINGFLRTPSLVGESASYGIFSFFSLVMILDSKKKVLSIIPILNIALSLTRSVYLLTIIYLFIKFSIYIFRKLKKNSLYSLYILVPFALFLLVLTFTNNNVIFNVITDSFSLFDRIKYWDQIIRYLVENNPFITILFGNIGAIGYGSSFSFSSTLTFLISFDNTWLFLFNAIGIFGLLLYLFILIKIFRKYEETKIIFLSLIIPMIFINFLQGESFISMMPISLFYLINLNGVNT